MKYFTILKTAVFLAIGLPVMLHAQSAESVMVMEAYSGKILIASNANEKRPIASLTKIATGAVAIDWANATNADIGSLELTVPQTITLVGGANPMNLQPGDRMTLRDALYASLLGSDNLAALTIADHVGREILRRRGATGDPVAEFVGEMNRLAKGIGMTNTRFANPHGLERKGAKAYSTAADVARMSVYAMRQNAFNYIVRQTERQITVNSPGSKHGFRVKNTNQLVGEPGVLGVKTGATTGAGLCVSVCMDREPLVRKKADGTKGATPRRLITVVLNNPDRFNRARGLIRQGWSIYDSWLSSGALVEDRKRELIEVPMPQ
jgi:D-alanyl-D-alanine carboxypeptidase (penicillin-binding protein 5/6)